MLDLQDRLEFERLLQWLRLTFLTSPFFVLAAFGWQGLPFALLIGVVVAGSYAYVEWLLRRHPMTFLRIQLGVRMLDCLLAFTVLAQYHAFLRDAYYDSVYMLFVLSAGATHGRRGVVLLSAFAGVLVLLCRLQLVARGVIPFEMRHVTDSGFYTIFFVATGLAVAFLMRRSAHVVERRDREWRGQVAERNLDLERAVAERNRALADAQAALRARDDFLAAASHDLKNPLTVILGSAQALERQVKAGTLAPERVATRLKRLGDAASRMAAQLDELVEAARNGMVELARQRREPVDLLAMARSAVIDHQTNAGERLVRLEAAGEALVGEWDPVGIERVLDNLLSNAIKYTPEIGEITVGVCQEEQEGRPWARLTVRDDGIGIPEADVPRIFERFYRASNVGGGISGTGVGLAAVQHIVLQHGGTIDVWSREGEGTEITVRLPLANGASAAA